MKKLIYTFGILSTTVFSAVSQTKSIAFEHGTFQEIKAKALKENKLIFIDAYTTWCGPCKQMAKNVFTNDAVADYFNTNLVNAKIDMEKGEGIEIAKLYEVSCYPNLLFIDGNGVVVHRIAGSMSAKDFIKFAEETKKPEGCYSYYPKNYEANKTNTEFLLKYIEARESTCLRVNDLVKDYFLLQKEEDLTNKKNWEMIKSHVNDMNSKEFNYLISNKAKYEKSHSTKDVNEKIKDVCKQTLLAIVRVAPFDDVKYQDTKSKISALNFTDSKQILFESDLSLFRIKLDWDSFAKLAIENVDAYYSNNADMLNGISWDFYEHVNGKDDILKAEQWAKKACDLGKNYAVFDTYASVLYKSGKKDLAFETANKAIELAKKEKYAPNDYKGTTELLQKIKELK